MLNDICKNRDCCSGQSLFFSDNNAHHASVGIVHDLLHGLLQLHLTFFTDHRQLPGNTVIYKLFYCFSENVGFPDAFLSGLGLGNIPYQILCLFLTSYDRRDLCFNVGTDHMDARALCPDLYAKLVAMPDQLRFI